MSNGDIISARLSCPHVPSLKPQNGFIRCLILRRTPQAIQRSWFCFLHVQCMFLKNGFSVQNFVHYIKYTIREIYSVCFKFSDLVIFERNTRTIASVSYGVW